MRKNAVPGKWPNQITKKYKYHILEEYKSRSTILLLILIENTYMYLFLNLQLSQKENKALVSIIKHEDGQTNEIKYYSHVLIICSVIENL